MKITRNLATILAIVLAGSLVVVAWLVRGPPWDIETSPETTGDPIKHFCSACHAYAEPTILPRSKWKEEIDKMYELAGLDKEITGIPPIEDTLRRYLRGAPLRVPAPETYVDRPPGPRRFEASGFRRHKAPAVSYLAYLPFPDDRRNLLACDMRTGEVLLQRLHLPDRPVEVLARLRHPCHLEVVDLDADGRRDLIVAELGSFLPGDHNDGKVIWLRGRPGGGVDVVPLLENVGRVADVRAADLDADGDLDLAVAVFGWRTTGKVLVMTNMGERDGRGVPKFDTEQLDPRVGAINVPIVDLDGDGRLDIVALLSQHHETVVAYLSDGDDWFVKRTIYEAPHPDWGTSGIEVVDLDRDGDKDVVLVCGDTLDTDTLHRHQGVYWLENEGRFPFRVHRLAGHVGAHKVRAADLDGDGDLDLVASSFLPQLRVPGRPVPRLDSVIWIEQTARGRFTPHPIEAVRCDHPALEVGDFDGDGDIDIAVGSFVEGPRRDGTDWWTLFDNAGPR